MQSVQFFRQIANNVPRCSFHAKAMKEFLITFSRDLGYEVLEDDAGNLLARKHRHAKLAFQSHYDIVCVGAQPPKLIEKDGWLCANGSSIGADNGAGIGLMMSLMQDYDECEYLFTNDEEVGLLGAKNLDLNINARKLINFDGFVEGEIVIGCAGSIHLKLDAHIFEKKDTPHNHEAYLVEISNLQGGHSGLDIDKNIPNAIILLLTAIKNSNAAIVSFEGGEKINSIPTSAKAVVWASDISEFVKINANVTKLENASKPFKDSKHFVDTLLNLKLGVLGKNIELGVVDTSVNLSIVKQNEKGFEVELFIRSMSDENQEDAALDIIKSWESAGFESIRLESHGAWTPYMSPLALDLKVAMKPFYHQASFNAVHAGLECAIFCHKFPGIELASVGPNIVGAHSSTEKLEIASLERTERAVRAFMQSLSKE